MEQVDAGNKLTGSFEVIQGGMMDVDVTVRMRTGPRGSLFQQDWLRRQVKSF